MSASDTIVDAAAPSSTDELAAAWIGKTLEERYRLLDVLGAGGFAVVFRAKHLTLGRDVAVKILQPQKGDDTVLARFEREAEVLARLAHPGIVAATDYGVSGATPFLVMELVEGRTLRDVIDEGPLPVERALAITRQILRALAYAHGHGVLHRDLKPGNVVAFTPDVIDGEEPEPVVKVLDFGLAKLVRPVRSDASITAEGVAFGTAGYVSPEVLSGRPADARSDLYAIGVMLFEMLVGRRPHGGRSRGDELRLTVTTATPPSLADVAPELPCVGELDAVLQLALARRPSERFADANAMLAALDQIDPHAAPQRTVRVSDATPTPRSWKDVRVPLPIVLVAVAVPTAIAALLAIVVLAMLLG